MNNDKDFDFTDHTDRSLVTDISNTLNNLSRENRAKRRMQKLREELVREYIDNKKQPPSFLKSLFSKLLISNRLAN
jgi:hypothetical protein